MLDIRPSPIAGKWYNGNAKFLAEEIDRFFANVQLPAIHGELIGVIAPHAGHQYAGQVAAHAFATLRGTTPEWVAILSPFHNFSQYPLLTTKHDAYSTPLGKIEVDTQALEELQTYLEIPITPVSRDREHSLEIELPFLQRILSNQFKLLPVMICEQELQITKQLGIALGKTLKNKNAIIVASTDLSHFYDQRTANLLDHEMLKRFESFEPESVFEAEESEKGFACGRSAVAAALWAAKELGANKVQVLNYATSGDVTKDFSSVVGYGAAAILKTI
jgi:AmmeMemoRadiSam system protein B